MSLKAMCLLTNLGQGCYLKILTGYLWVQLNYGDNPTVGVRLLKIKGPSVSKRTKRTLQNLLHMHTRAVKCNPKLTHFRNVSLETEGKNQKQEYENGKKKQKNKKKNRIANN